VQSSRRRAMEELERRRQAAARAIQHALRTSPRRRQRSALANPGVDGPWHAPSPTGSGLLEPLAQGEPAADVELLPQPLPPLVIEVGQLELLPWVEQARWASGRPPLQRVAVCAAFHEALLGAVMPPLQTPAAPIQASGPRGAGLLTAAFGCAHHIQLNKAHELELLCQSLFSPAEFYSDLVFSVHECAPAAGDGAPEGGHPAAASPRGRPGPWVGEAFVNLQQHVFEHESQAGAAPELAEVLSVYDSESEIIGHLTVTVRSRATLRAALAMCTAGCACAPSGEASPGNGLPSPDFADPPPVPRPALTGQGHRQRGSEEILGTAPVSVGGMRGHAQELAQSGGAATSATVSPGPAAWPQTTRAGSDNEGAGAGPYWPPWTAEGTAPAA